MAKLPTPQELIASRPEFPSEPWLDIKPQFAPGSFCYPAKKETMELLHMPNPHDWDPAAEDWNLPENWEQILCDAFEERLQKHRSLKLFMDICVRCGACADKCHFFLGTNDPKNMPVLRAELLRSLYRRDYTKLGKILGKRAGARSWDKEVVKELFYYAYQCTECRRCSLFCPYGIDTAEITVIVRQMLLDLGLGIHWIMNSVNDCNRTGNHLGVQPHSMREIVEFLCDDIETITGIRVDPPWNEKGHEVIFITPSGDYFADPGIYTFMGYLMLFHEIGLDYTLSTYASEGGNFGSFVSFDVAKRLNAKMYAEAERLGSKWILGGECGHMWRVVNQYMATYNGPTPPKMETPVSPITGTVFKNAAATKMVHIAEFTADLIKHNKLNLRPERCTFLQNGIVIGASIRSRVQRPHILSLGLLFLVILVRCRPRRGPRRRVRIHVCRRLVYITYAEARGEREAGENGERRARAGGSRRSSDQGGRDAVPEYLFAGVPLRESRVQEARREHDFEC